MKSKTPKKITELGFKIRKNRAPSYKQLFKMSDERADANFRAAQKWKEQAETFKALYEAEKQTINYYEKKRSEEVNDILKKYIYCLFE